jgi:hypothetical protein
VLSGARKIVRATTDTPTGFELWIRGQGTPKLFPPAPGSEEQEVP